MIKSYSRFVLVSTFLVALFACSGNNSTPPAAVYPIPSDAQVDWHKLETYAFVHFGLNTFNDMEWGFGDTPASTFDPTNLDADQWARVIKTAGFKGIILTAKHHDGFCLWPSKYTQYSVKNSPWKGGKGDLVGDVVAACRRHGLKFGFYLSPWDRNRADYGTPSYVEYYHNQIRELYDNYTDSVEVFEQWFDGANGGDGYYGGSRDKRQIDAFTYYNYAPAIDYIHAKFPSAMIFGGTHPTIRWVGNERGFAGETNWAARANSLAVALYGSPNGVKNDSTWLPAECDVSIRPGWFYHQREDSLVHSLPHLLDIYYGSVGRGATLLLNFPVAIDGRIHPIDSARIMDWRAALDVDFRQNLTHNAQINTSTERGEEFGAKNIVDNNWDTYWSTPDGVTTGSVELDFGQPITFNRVVLQEYIPLGQRTEQFSVEYFDKGEWIKVPSTDSTTTIGYKRILRTEPTTTKRLKINILKSRGEMAINNMELYLAPDHS